MTPKVPQEAFELGPFQLLSRTKVLLRDGHPVAIAPRAVEVLLVLAEQANAIVSKDDLMRAVWPDTFVEEVNLTVHVSALRKLLADAGDAVQIETVPKRGYRLKLDVRPVPEPPGQAGGTGVAQPGERLLRPGTLAAIGLAAALLVWAGIWLERWASPPQERVSAGGARIDSLAVLPLENLSGDPKQDYFATGITDDLTTQLAHIHGLRVVSRTSASQFRGEHVSMPQIARALGVKGVIEGSVVRSGNRVRITTQLIDAENDRHLWAGTYEDSVDEVITLQDRVARDVAREVRAAVKPDGELEPAAPAGRASGVDRRAYDDYLKGLYVWNRRDERTYDKAVEYFTRAGNEDPEFAPAFASLANVYVLSGLNHADGERFAPLARQAAIQALAKDANSAEAHAALAATSAVFDWSWETAGREFQRAIDLDPNYATGHQWYADFYLAPELKLADATREMDTALSLDPLSPIMFVDAGFTRYLRGEYPQARQRYERALAVDPDFVPAHFCMAKWYLAQGREADYARVSAEAAERDVGLVKGREAVEKAFARDGLRGLARAELGFAGPGRQEAAGIVEAEYDTMLGDSPRACSALREGLRLRQPALLYLNVDPTYAALRKLPCYGGIARQMGLPQLTGPSSVHAGR